MDLYTAGPPCQPYSSSVARNGLEDVGSIESGARNRGTVLFDVLGCIVAKRPKVFIIEEVGALMQGSTEPVFNTALRALKASLG